MFFEAMELELIKGIIVLFKLKPRVNVCVTLMQNLHAPWVLIKSKSRIYGRHSCHRDFIALISSKGIGVDFEIGQH